jgi:hypothetical protein
MKELILEFNALREKAIREIIKIIAIENGISFDTVEGYSEIVCGCNNDKIVLSNGMIVNAITYNYDVNKNYTKLFVTSNATATDPKVERDINTISLDDIINILHHITIDLPNEY